MTKIAEDADPQKIQAMRRRPLPAECGVDGASRYLVHFHVDRVRSLVGDGPEA